MDLSIINQKGGYYNNQYGGGDFLNVCFTLMFFGLSIACPACAGAIIIIFMIIACISENMCVPL